MNDNANPKDKSGKLSQALSILEEIHAAGYAIVPTEPTPAIVQAGMSVSNLPPETIVRIYLAMIARAGDEPLSRN
jgi:hypothetical protein